VSGLPHALVGVREERSQLLDRALRRPLDEEALDLRDDRIARVRRATRS
jgi:hypothetical protein